MTPASVILRLVAVIAFYAVMVVISIVYSSGKAKAESHPYYYGGDQAWISKTLNRQLQERHPFPHWEYEGRRYAPAHYQRLGWRAERPQKSRRYHYDWSRRSERDWERDDDDRFSGRRCRSVERAVGKEDNNPAHAKASARQQWMESVRFKWGVRFMDPVHAKGARYVCARSGTGGRAGEKVLKAVPFAKTFAGGEFLTQCEVRARPCEAPEVSAEDGDEDKD